MKILDVNLLLYALDSQSAHHANARNFLDRVLNTDETVGLPWPVILGFLSMVTNARVFPQACSGCGTGIADANAALTAIAGAPPAGNVLQNNVARVIAAAQGADNRFTMVVPAGSAVTAQVPPVAEAYCTDQPPTLCAVVLRFFSSMKSWRSVAPVLPPPP